MSNAVGKSFRPGPEAAARGEYIVQFVRHLAEFGELVCKIGALRHFPFSNWRALANFLTATFFFNLVIRTWYFSKLVLSGETPTLLWWLAARYIDWLCETDAWIVVPPMKVQNFVWHTGRVGPLPACSWLDGCSHGHVGKPGSLGERERKVKSQKTCWNFHNFHKNQ